MIFKLHVALAISCSGKAITMTQPMRLFDRRPRWLIVERSQMPDQYLYTLHMLCYVDNHLDCETSTGLFYPSFREELNYYFKMGCNVMDYQEVWKPYTEAHERLFYDESGKAIVL